MELLFTILLGAALLGLNFFFVLAEFALVKVRATRVAELVEAGGRAARRARVVQRIHARMDDYLSVAQVGITGATLGIGVIIEGGVAEPLGKLFSTIAPNLAGLSHAVAFLLVTFLVIVTSELLPKAMALRTAEPVALWCARPMLWVHHLLYPLLWLMTRLAQLLMRCVGMRGGIGEDAHSEDELRIILDRSQSRGLLSFRRLLFIENVFDLGGLTVKNAMRPRAQVRCLHASLGMPDNLQTLRTWRYSRFPLIADDPERPVGVVHVKDLLFAFAQGHSEPDLGALARPLLTTTESASLEALMAEMQRRRIHVALVRSADDRWTGLISFEDLLEEIVGTIGDEFEVEDQVLLADALTQGRVVLGIEARSLSEAIALVLRRIPANELPAPADGLISAVQERERLAATYLGSGIAMPHARLPGLSRPVLLIARSDLGIPVAGATKDRAHLLFILLTPASAPRVHQRMQATIAGMIENSAFVADRLRDAPTPADVVEVIRAGEQAALG